MSSTFAREIRGTDAWRPLGPGLFVALSLGAAHGCYGEVRRGDSESHFIRCATDKTCLTLGEAYRCMAGRCRDTSGSGAAGTAGSVGLRGDAAGGASESAGDASVSAGGSVFR